MCTAISFGTCWLNPNHRSTDQETIYQPNTQNQSNRPPAEAGWRTRRSRSPMKNVSVFGYVVAEGTNSAKLAKPTDLAIVPQQTEDA